MAKKGAAAKRAKARAPEAPVSGVEPISATAAKNPQITTVLRVVGSILVVGGSIVFLAPAFHEFVESIAALGTAAPFIGGALAVIGVVLLLVALQREGVPETRDWPELRPQDLLLPHLFAKNFLWRTWMLLDAEAAQEREKRAATGKGYDWRPLVVFTSGAVLLALMEYCGHANPPSTVLPPLLRMQQLVDWLDQSGESWRIVIHSRYAGLYDLGWWAVWRVIGFFLLPAITLKLMGEKISDYGLQTRGFLQHAWIYALFFFIVLVTVIIVSFDEHFQTYYPFYKGSSRSWYDFGSWELLYAAQFFSLEFFFRGFWLHAAKRAMGSHAIYAMVVPYCMIHFGKPFPETVAAILAGVVLGTLALRTRSIWSGFLIHVSVAVSMDLAALLQTTGLPQQWWPTL